MVSVSRSPGERVSVRTRFINSEANKFIDKSKPVPHSHPMNAFLVLLFATNALAAKLVTQTVGQVADYVLTSREVQIVTVIEGVLFPASGVPPKTPVEVRPGMPSFRSSVTNVVLEAVVAMEAENFNVSNLSGEEIAAAVSKVEKATAGKAYWNELEVSSQELKRFVTRKLMAKSFLKFKTSSMAGIITDQEAQDYYERNRVKFGSSTFENFKENIKTYLAQQQLEERIRAWFEVIKRKYRVRTFVVEG